MTTRKEFIAAGSLFALAPAHANAAAKPGLTFKFDQARFDRILTKPAKHKQCFGVTKIEGGDVLEQMNNSIQAYREYLGEGPGALQTVAVLYHGAAIAMAMSDSVWNQVLIPSLPKAPAEIRVQFGHAKPGKGNPFLRSASADSQDLSVERLGAQGASFFVCHNAIVGFSELAASALQRSKSEVHAAILAGIVTHALVVPAGVMAINACQEAKFTYIQTSS